MLMNGWVHSLRNLAACGHIEDIAVASEQQGKKLGLLIIQTLDAIAQAVGCYKAILDCSEKNRPFYEKCGYKLAGIQMVSCTARRRDVGWEADADRRGTTTVARRRMLLRSRRRFGIPGSYRIGCLRVIDRRCWNCFSTVGTLQAFFCIATLSCPLKSSTPNNHPTVQSVIK